MEIFYSNINTLSDEEKFALEKVIENKSKKIERLLKDKAKLKVHIKTARKGNRKRFILNYMLETPSKVFTTKSKDTEEAADFDIVKATHREMNHLLNEVQHHVRKDEPTWKKYSFKGLFARLK